MDKITLIILRLTCALVMSAGAVLLAYEGKDGWGWLLFGALILGGITIKDGVGE